MLLQDDSEVAEELNKFFKEAVLDLDANEIYIINLDPISMSDPIEKAISKYKVHASILLINDKIINQENVLFNNPISKVDIE